MQLLLSRKGEDELKGQISERTLLGHPSCPKVMAAVPEQLLKIEKTRPVGLVLPPVTPSAETCLELILDEIRKFEDAEITANDWGTLSRTAEWKRQNHIKVTLIMGILLSGQESDPVIRQFTFPQKEQILKIGPKTVLVQWEKPPETLMNYWREPSAFHMTGFLRDMGVDAIELGLQPLPIKNGSIQMPVRSVPYGVMSVQPCGGDCTKCGGKDLIRAGCRLFFDRNLLKWEYTGNE